MTISKELFLAILSMDAYNRGYGAGLSDGGAADTDGLGEGGSQIGYATVMDIDLPAGSQSFGFYAVAYDDPNYGKIISYRGTDNYGALPNDLDVLNGYGIAMGSALGEQARLAA